MTIDTLKAMQEALESEENRIKAAARAEEEKAVQEKMCVAPVPRTALTVPELAASIGISRSGAYELVRRKDFPSIRIGERWFVPVTDLQEWLSEQTERAEAYMAYAAGGGTV